MLQFWGTLREKMGKPVQKAVLVRKTHEGMYQDVARHYWSVGEQFWQYEKNKRYELHPENNVRRNGEVVFQYINVETGNPVSMDDKPMVAHRPEILSRMMKVDHVEGAVRASLGSGAGLIIPIMALIIGLAIGFLLAQNLPAISQAISPTPTPPWVAP